jgi:hypothetical protein
LCSVESFGLDYWVAGVHETRPSELAELGTVYRVCVTTVADLQDVKGD